MQATSVVTVIEPGRSARRTPRSPEKRPGRAPPRLLLPESLCGITCGLSVGPRPHAVDVRTPGPRRGAPGSWDRRTCHSQLPSRHSCFELFFFPFLLNHERGLKFIRFVFLGPPSEAIARVSPSRPSSRSWVIRHRGVFTLPGSARRGFTGLCVSARGRESSRPRSPHSASVWRWGQESPAPRPPLPRIRPPAERPGRTVLSVMIVGRLLRASSILEVQRYSGSSPDLPQTWQRVSFLEFTRARPPGRPE